MNRAAVREVADLYFARFEARLEKGLAEVRSEVDKGLSEVRSEMDKGFSKVRSEMDVRLADQRADLIKWMFLFWIGTLVPLAGLMIALTRR